MSQNRHTSLLRKFRKNNKRKRSSEQVASSSYETLEPRQLLAIDFGVGSGLVDVTTDTFGGAPNPTVAVGPNHIVQVQNGEFRIFDKATGASLVDKALDAFWTDTGNGDAVGAEADARMVGGTKNARIVYDNDTRRWFIVASSDGIDLITGNGAEGTQVPVLVAVSRTSDPTLDWQSMADTYDDDNDIVNGEGDPPTAPVRIDGGFLPDRTRANNPRGWFLNLAVDDDNLMVTVDGPVTKTYLFNKFSLLVVPTPQSGATFPDAALGFDAASGFQQFNTEIDGVVAGTFGLDTSVSGDAILLSELTNTASVHGASAEPEILIPVDPFEAPPIFIRQEFDPDIVNSGVGQISSPVRLGNSLWAVHTIKGSSDAQNPDGGTIENSAIRWYEVDLDTKTIKQSGTIEHPWKNYIYPSIAVTQEGHVVIGFTSTGVSPDGPSFGQFPSVAVAVGYSNNGSMTFEEPVVLKDGDGGYLDAIGNFWGSYNSTWADPDDPTKVWVSGQWSTGSAIPNGQNQITEIELLGLSGFVDGDENDNTFIVRRSAVDDTQIEVELDGMVVETYEEANLYEVTLTGGGGNDVFIIDTVNGEFDFPNGVNIVGDGDDQVIMDTVEKTNFEVFVNGSGTASVGTNVPAICEFHEDVAQVFTLNFEAGSAWFDATPYGLNGYATQGDALRGELQNYFDNIMAPLFSNSFSMELDINDDETDSLASARALGYGLEDVNGQELMVASPWSIMTGRGDRNGDNSDGEIDYNLDLALYQDDFEALLENISGGLTRNQFFRILGMESEIPNETTSFDPRGTRNFGTVMDVGYRDLNGNPLIGNYDAVDSMFDVMDYQTNALWAGDNTGIYFMGYDDTGAPMPLFVNSNAELIDFDTLASALAGTSRDGDFNDIVEQDRAFLRGMGFTLNPVIPVEQLPGQPVRFVGIDKLQSGAGEDYFCIRSSNVDLEIKSGLGNDFFNVTGLGVGALNLFGEGGDDTYQVVFSPAGVLTIVDSPAAENDTLIGRGTSGVDHYVFDANGVKVNGGLLVYVGIENTSFDGLEGDDIFDIKRSYRGVAGLTGGDGIDSFVIDAASTVDTLTISVDDPNVDPVDRLRLDMTSQSDASVADAFTADEIENFHVNGTFVVDGVNGTPSVAGLTLIGDGNELLTMESMLEAQWNINGDGAGDVQLEQPLPIAFTGVSHIEGSHGVDNFNVLNTGTDLLFDAREGADEIVVDNSGFGEITVNGNAGSDQFTIRNSGGGVILSGNSGSDMFTVNDVGAGPTMLSGNDGGDVFLIQYAQNSVEMLGGNGGDRFTISFGALGGARADGQEGSDVYQIALGSQNNRMLYALDTGVNGLDRINASLTNLHDDFDLVDELITVATDKLQFNSNFQSLIVNGKQGNDEINIDRSSVNYLRIIAGDGDDDINLRNTLGIRSTVVEAGAGFDDVFADVGLPGSYVTAYGGDGNDSFLITQRQLGNIVVDGQEGSDRYDAFLADSSPRFMVARDSGVNGLDHLTVHGTESSDIVEFRSGVVRTINQDILYDATTESMTLMTGGAGDSISVFGLSSATTNIMSQAGNDVVHVVSTHGSTGAKTLNVDAGSGNDSVLVSGTNADTTTNLFGREGDDNLSLGSSFTDNNGNLNQLQGRVFASGGDGSDRVYINDLGKTGAFNYRVGPTYVINNGSPTNYFAGLQYDTTVEVLRLDSTSDNDDLLVTPSFDTKFSFFGNGGVNTLNLTGDPDDDGRELFGQSGGDGVWRFTNGAMDVFFSDFFVS